MPYFAPLLGCYRTSSAPLDSGFQEGASLNEMEGPFLPGAISLNLGQKE